MDQTPRSRSQGQKIKNKTLRLLTSEGLYPAKEPTTTIDPPLKNKKKQKGLQKQ